jgi:tRNA threonylcarbamoyladenosine biosynthesis protein TsaB
MSVILAIDTAAPRLQLALRRADGTVDVSIDEIAQGHAELLFTRLGGLLERNHLGYPDLTRIAVTTGPGSFTGLRIGLSAARGLGVARSVPVLGIPSLQAISLSAAPGHPTAVLLDARRGEAYFQRFFSPGEPWGSASLLPIDEARALMQAGVTAIASPFCDIAALAIFAVGLNPALLPPEASYVRGADAKPQDKARVARLGATRC